MPGFGDDSLVGELVERGITPRGARKLVARFDRHRIESNIRLFDSMEGRGGEGVIRKRAGWLYSAVVNDFAAETPTASAPARPAAVAPPAAAAQPARVAAEEAANPMMQAFEAFWDAIDPRAREVFEAEAVASAPVFLQRQYNERIESKGSLWRVTRLGILLAHFTAGSRGPG